MRPWAPTLALCLTLCVTPPVRADNTKEAKAWFVKARSDFEDGRYGPALEALRRAHSLQRLPLLLRYIGDCHDKLGEHQQAVKSYRAYLARLPDAPDRTRVEQRIADNEAGLKAAREKRYRSRGERKVPVHLMPTGKDRENPLRVAGARRRVDQPHRTWLTVSKWAALGVAASGLAMGITFNRLAAGKAEDLRESMRTDCPPGNPACGGNPDLNRPVVSYSLEHYELQREIKRRNAITVGSFVVGGVAAATSAVLFFLDRRGRDRGARRSASNLSVTPALGPRTCGLVGEVSFQ
jgi:tetratricopeptide (TPR) repeat protein